MPRVLPGGLIPLPQVRRGSHHGATAATTPAWSDGQRLSAVRHYIEEEIAGQGADPRREVTQIRTRIVEIDDKAAVLLDGMTPETKDFINTKLRDLSAEKRRLEERIAELEAAPFKPIDADAVLRDGLAGIRDLPRLMESGSLEERKEFIRAFVEGITVHPDALHLEVQMRKIPALGPGFPSVELVAGAGFEPATFGL